MAVTVVFLATVMAIAAWWLARQRLTAKPWLEEGPAGEHPGTGALPLPAAKVGLGVFLAVVGSLFALFVSAYSMRMHMGDWRPLAPPKLLWLNTGMLLLGSGALQAALLAARRDRMESARAGLLAGGLATMAFLVGQLMAWRQLAASGQFLADSPAVAFFYLITAAHGLHLLGGIVALGRAYAKAWREPDAGQIRLSVELCATYWHFLLLVWLILFGLLFLH